MRVLLFLVFFAFEVLASEEPNCSIDEPFTGKLFELEIQTSFSGRYVFEFCFDSRAYLLSEYHEPIRLTKSVRSTIVNESKVKLPESAAHKIKELYSQASVNIKSDSIRGMDGDTWCFRPKSGMSYSEICIWSPQVDAVSRGHKNLVELGKYLYEVSTL